MVKLFDSHCHLQDPRIFNKVPQLIRTALDKGIVHFAVNGISERDWDLVKQMSDNYRCVIPCFGLHPWFVEERTPRWLSTLKEFFDHTPSAAVGEIGLDKGSKGKEIDFTDQMDVFSQQLELAKELKRPASVHCVRAYGDLLRIMKSLGPFPAGIILHSYLGSAELVPEFAELGAYFSFSGFLMSMKESKAKKMLKSVPAERILLETDAPDALPKANDLNPLFSIDGDGSALEGFQNREENYTSNDGSKDANDISARLKEALNHPANIHHVLKYVASLLEMSEEEVADLSYGNAIRVFSYEGSKVLLEVTFTSTSKFVIAIFSFDHLCSASSSTTETDQGPKPGQKLAKKKKGQLWFVRFVQAFYVQDRPEIHFSIARVPPKLSLQRGTTIRGDAVVNFVQKVERDRSNPENGPVAQQNGAREDEVGLAVSGYKFRSPDSFSESESVDQSASTTDQPRSQERSVDTQLLVSVALVDLHLRVRPLCRNQRYKGHGREKPRSHLLSPAQTGYNTHQKGRRRRAIAGMMKTEEEDYDGGRESGMTRSRTRRNRR
ncbi:hypothetical protein U1Q18_010750 [Sarracenia purpurea var. burkii]